MKSVDDYDSFITSIDDYSCYGYVYPIKERIEALDKFKIFEVEVENQNNFKDKDIPIRLRGGSTTIGTPHMAKFLDLCKVLRGK